MAARDDNTLAYVFGGALLFAILFGGGKAKAAEPPPPQEDVDPFEGYGSTPKDLAILFMSAEDAAGIPGLGRFLAVYAWGAFRAFQPFLAPEEAAIISANNPAWCTNCHNTSNSEVIASRRALERVILAKGVQGQYGTGAYDPPWPLPADADAWADFGSAGLLDILAGSHAHSGIHDGGFTPLIASPPSILFDPRVSTYAATVLVHRLLSVKLYQPGIYQKTARETWSRIRVGTASPDTLVKFAAGTATPEQKQYAVDVMARFQGRAVELGVDLDAMPNPTKAVNAKWPGAEAVYNNLVI